jgi:hypothetical protein
MQCQGPESVGQVSPFCLFHLLGVPRDCSCFTFVNTTSLEQ